MKKNIKYYIFSTIIIILVGIFFIAAKKIWDFFFLKLIPIDTVFLYREVLYCYIPFLGILIMKLKKPDTDIPIHYYVITALIYHISMYYYDFLLLYWLYGIPFGLSDVIYYAFWPNRLFWDIFISSLGGFIVDIYRFIKKVKAKNKAS